jgi:hypothetical protein
MRELHGKGWRVIGYFVWMLGAGVVLDSDQAMLGRVVLVTGAAIFVLGTWQTLRGAERSA